MTKQLTAEERLQAAQYLASTRDRLLLAVSGLSPAQWHFKPAPEQWSVAEILEHMLLVEQAVHGIVAGIADAAPAEPDRIDAQVDQYILEHVPLRANKFQAPPFLLPNGRWQPPDIVDRFHETRSTTLHLLDSASCLRGRVVPHPALGPWDGYQWILGGAAHGARHTAQIEEVKALAARYTNPHALHDADLQPGE